MRLQTPRENVVDRFARAHRQCSNEDWLATLRFSATVIESCGDVVDPFFFFRTVRKDEFESAARSRSWSFPSVCRLFFATNEEEGETDKNIDRKSRPNQRAGFIRWYFCRNARLPQELENRASRHRRISIKPILPISQEMQSTDRF